MSPFNTSFVRLSSGNLIDKFFDYTLEVANKFDVFRQILRKSGADELSLTELNRYEYISMHFNHHDKFLSEVLFYDSTVLTQAFLEKFPELAKGYYEEYREHAEINQIYDKYKQIVIDAFSVVHPELIFYLELQDKLMSGYVFLPEALRNSLKTKTVLDFGGYNGVGALMFSEFVRQVYVFEPMEHYSTMANNINEYCITGNIKPYKLGVGAKPDVLKFYQSPFQVGQSRVATADDLINHPNDITEMQVTSIDNFVREENITDLGLMKFDIEGTEYDAIQGGLETIKQYKPVLLISIYHNPRDFFEIIKVIDDLNLGYKFILRNMLVDKNVSWTLFSASEFVLICWCE